MLEFSADAAIIVVICTWAPYLIQSLVRLVEILCRMIRAPLFFRHHSHEDDGIRETALGRDETSDHQSGTGVGGVEIEGESEKREKEANGSRGNQTFCSLNIVLS